MLRSNIPDIPEAEDERSDLGASDGNSPKTTSRADALFQNDLGESPLTKSLAPIRAFSEHELEANQQRIEVEKPERQNAPAEAMPLTKEPEKSLLVQAIPTHDSERSIKRNTVQMTALKSDFVAGLFRKSKLIKKQATLNNPLAFEPVGQEAWRKTIVDKKLILEDSLRRPNYEEKELSEPIPSGSRPHPLSPKREKNYTNIKNQYLKRQSQVLRQKEFSGDRLHTNAHGTNSSEQHISSKVFQSPFRPQLNSSAETVARGKQRQSLQSILERSSRHQYSKFSIMNTSKNPKDRLTHPERTSGVRPLSLPKQEPGGKPTERPF